MSIEINEDYFEVFIDGPAIAKYFTAAERDEIKRRVRTSCSSSESARIAELEKALKQAKDALISMRDLARRTSALQSRAHVDLGISVNHAIDEARTTLEASERGGE
ncbi:hypothetical protein Hden_1538 [Hyphomicrobium denitrificans ATCC 51888]|uniref:Uncharacterized protein n=1 Tax=Hyphomicrobium denitrificans (strain ATCC 51888 / DSM 1869 / NCIMB 11706 / TK 0415) TaxID=582899 RepID=D8JQ24_HYPDA|nr:hypothetical protein [Hyphomicrobium denitrificans]ADJ21945.1 hypothetical protein Hden_0118 [Hyphomicrobium denitrificans ATCC 51888]ADJ23350.1 hypothetical protein Hden_1538 [Hyphomicrobium denitrificans ATCC 51888]